MFNSNLLNNDYPWRLILGKYLNNIPTVILLIIVITYLYLAFIKKVSLKHEVTFFCITATPTVCCFFITFKWYFAISTIILFSVLVWLAYSNEITAANRFILKGIKNSDKREALKLEIAFNKTHSKEELMTIQQLAKKSPRIKLPTFLLASWAVPAIYFIFLIMLGVRF
jgi:hypothetical protein